jgi:hypothetical protein
LYCQVTSVLYYTALYCTARLHQFCTVLHCTVLPGGRSSGCSQLEYVCSWRCTSRLHLSHREVGPASPASPLSQERREGIQDKLQDRGQGEITRLRPLTHYDVSQVIIEPEFCWSSTENSMQTHGALGGQVLMFSCGWELTNKSDWPGVIISSQNKTKGS